MPTIEINFKSSTITMRYGWK